MNIVQCSKSSDHWFDRDLNHHCPLCGALALGENGGGKSVSSIESSTSTQKKYGGGEKTEDFWDVSTSTPVSTSNVTEENSQDSQGAGPVTYHNSAINDQTPTVPLGLEVPDQGQNSPVIPTSSLQETVRASVADSGKTMGYFEEMMESVAGVAGSVAASSFSNPAEQGIQSAKQTAENATLPPVYVPTTPVVGWLVAVSGPHFGQGFPLTDGKNSIGRESENQVILSRDKGVSRVRQAVLIYDPLHSQFYVQPGSESSQLAYLNGKMLKGIEDLKEKDIVMVGKTKLLFVPLCGENFSWEDYIGEK